MQPMILLKHYQVFDYTTYTNGTLYVPEAAIEKCKQIYPWLRFSNIQSLDFNRIDDATADFEETLPVYIYDLNGIMVGNDTKSLPSGVYIVRHGNKAKKISVNWQEIHTNNHNGIQPHFQPCKDGHLVRIINKNGRSVNETYHLDSEMQKILDKVRNYGS